MTNNKQSMKLYTEEQVRQMLEVCRDSDLYEHILTFEDILKTETPIELPSDEEMIKAKYEHEICVFADEYASYVLEQSKPGIKGAMVSMCAWTFFKNRNNEQQ